MSVKLTSNFLTFFLFYSLFAVLAQDNLPYDNNNNNGLEDADNKEMVYEAPGTLTFPIGDEAMTNEDIQIDDDVIEDNYDDPLDTTSKKCPIDFHASCDEPSFEQPLPAIHCCDEGQAEPSQYCMTCNINLAKDGKGVVIRCHNCTTQGQSKPIDAQFLANFLQISTIDQNIQNPKD